MKIIGAHAVLLSRKPEADRVFFRDVLKLPHVDAGGGWLIFALPPSELAVHPADENSVHELFLMCDDIEAFRRAAAKRRIRCSPARTLSWGRLCKLSLPGGGRIGVYEPRHPRPKARGSARRRPGR